MITRIGLLRVVKRNNEKDETGSTKLVLGHFSKFNRLEFSIKMFVRVPEDVRYEYEARQGRRCARAINHDITVVRMPAAAAHHPRRHMQLVVPIQWNRGKIRTLPAVARTSRCNDDEVPDLAS
jgi:hypothetical protein